MCRPVKDRELSVRGALQVIPEKDGRRTFVDATPISGPALMWIPQCVSREIVEPTTLTTPTLSAPFSRQYRIARMVSAVSPDCETNKQVSSRKMGVLRSRKSDASSTEQGISVNSSKMARVCG